MVYILSQPTYRILRKWVKAMLFAVFAMLVSGCMVHEFPETPTTAPLCLHLRFDTDMPQTYYTISRSGAPVQSTQMCSEGVMRYIVRLYPYDVSAQDAAGAAYREYVVKRDVHGGYNTDINIDAPAGHFRIMVWADLSDSNDGIGEFYDAADFSGIKIKTPYRGSTDYRDAFRGETSAMVVVSTEEQSTVEATVDMSRPLAKFEFVANDVRLFIEQQYKAMVESGKLAASSADAARAVNLGMFRVRIIYNGYVPSTYNIFTDAPTDAAVGVQCDGSVRQLSDDEASLGFDYVLVNGHATEVTVQIGIYDLQGQMVSLSNAVNVPLRRSYHTIVRGEFLTQKALGGVGVNPNYDGEYNVLY